MKKLALLALYGVNRFNIELFGRANLIRVSTLFAPLPLLLPQDGGRTHQKGYKLIHCGLIWMIPSGH
jgi:hypothetical protein